MPGTHIEDTYYSYNARYIEFAYPSQLIQINNYIIISLDYVSDI